MAMGRGGFSLSGMEWVDWWIASQVATTPMHACSLNIGETPSGRLSSSVVDSEGNAMHLWT
jgi:hypothetical protein